MNSRSSLLLLAVLCSTVPGLRLAAQPERSALSVPAHPLDRDAVRTRVSATGSLARPNSTSGLWQALGTGTNGIVWALAQGWNGTYAGGQFTSTGGATTNHIARWDGSTWHPLGTGLAGFAPACYSIAVDSPFVYAGGAFTGAGTGFVNSVARWDGVAWQPLGSGVSSNSGQATVAALAVSGGHVYAGGSFSHAGGPPASNVARWNGTSWEPLGQGFNNTVRALLVIGDTVYAGGSFDSSGTERVRHIARWTGSQWVEVGGGADGDIYALARYGGLLHAGGVFQNAGGQPASAIAAYDGSGWSPLGSGIDLIVYGLQATPAGLFVAGLFTMAGGTPANHTALWDGTSWSSLGGGVNNFSTCLSSAYPRVHFGGAFTVAGTVAAAHVASWIDQGTTTLALLQGWNLVSLPRIPLTLDAATLIPGSYGGPYGFNTTNQNYDLVSTLAVGQGYWYYYKNPVAVTIQGSIIDSLDIAVPRAGWALVGALTDPVPLSALSTDPAGAVVPGTIYRYSSTAQRYETAVDFTPGEGHWVLLNTACRLLIKQ